MYTCFAIYCTLLNIYLHFMKYLFRHGGSLYELMLQQFPELTERDIVERSVEAVDSLGARDIELRKQ